jgi:hypothetical protein
MVGGAGVSRSFPFPRHLDDVAVGVAGLDAHVVGLLPLADDLDAVGDEAIAERADVVGTCEANAEVQELRQANRPVCPTESERESREVVQQSERGALLGLIEPP